MKKILIVIPFFIAATGIAQDKTADSLAKRKNEMRAIIMTQPKIKLKTIGIFVYNGFNTLDAMGPYQVLSQLMGTKVFFVAKEKGFVKNQSGLEFKVDQSIAEVKNLDMLLIPGGAA